MRLHKVNDKLFIIKRNHVSVLNIKDIIYIERIGTNAILQTLNRSVEVNLSLKHIIGELPSNFVRSHKSFIINKELILEIIPLNSNTVECVFSDDKSALLTKNNVELVFT